MHVGSHCSPNRDRKVITRCRIGINKVVKNVNSPDEDELAINDRQLAMEAANSCSKESKVQEAGAVDAYLNARFSERGKPASRKISCLACDMASISAGKNSTPQRSNLIGRGSDISYS